MKGHRTEFLKLISSFHRRNSNLVRRKRFDDRLCRICLGSLDFLVPIRPLIFVTLGWKLFTKLLYVPADTVTGI